MIGNPKCVECGNEMAGSHIHRKFCSAKCRGRFRKKHPCQPASAGHHCRVCKKHFEIGIGQNNKWICSDECRKKKNAESVRKFHKVRPERQAEYRNRQRLKLLPDGNLIRFYKWNPNAPRECESCGENRVLEIAHRPEHERVGQCRKRINSQWPKMVWVLCPTCHTLLDRMNYLPGELGLK